MIKEKAMDEAMKYMARHMKAGMYMSVCNSSSGFKETAQASN